MGSIWAFTGRRCRRSCAGRQVYDLTFTLGLPYTYPPVTLPLLVPLARLDAAGALTC